MMPEFHSLDVFVFANKEEASLEQVVSIIEKNNRPEDISKITVFAKADNCPSYFFAKKMIESGRYPKLEVYVQKERNIQRAYYEAALKAEATHFVFIAADMEMDPNVISEFISLAKKKPDSIICASKWHKNSVISGYGFLHEMCSRLLNTVAAWIIGSKAKDMFTLYQIYPKSVFDKMQFFDADTFMFEYSAKPILCGVDYVEIPTVYKKRSEGKSNYKLFILIYGAMLFLLTVIRLRLSVKKCKKK